MHYLQFGEADSFACESFNSGSEIQVFSFDFLGIALANFMPIRLKVALIGTPIVRVVTANAKGGKHCLQRLKNEIFTPAKYIGEDLVRRMINSMPEPALVGFFADIRPLLVQFSLTTHQLQPDLPNTFWV